MGNTIAVRIYDFLKAYPPFSLLPEDQLMAVSGGVVVQYRQPGETIFSQGEHPEAHIYVVREGAVHLLREENGTQILIDTCDEGDLFGIRPLLAEEPYAFTAVSQEESLIYAIPIASFTPLLEEFPKVAYYLATHFAAGAHQRFAKAYHGRLFLDQDHHFDNKFQLVEVQGIEQCKVPVTCQSGTLIRDAAREMSIQEVGSIIIVDEDHHPVGIVTDKDLRKHVATGKVTPEVPVDAIMSSPVRCIQPQLTVADVQMEMVQRRIHHLVITQDGTDQSPAIGVITEHDLLVVQGNNPAVLIREIKRAQTPQALVRIRERAEELLRKYIYQEVAIGFISSVITEVNDVLMARVIALCEQEMIREGQGPAPVRYCWLALGSEGRGEQLLRTDQDNCLVFEDVPTDDYPRVKEYFLALATKINTYLEACGFAYCPAEMMGRNPDWCLSLSQWKDQFTRWMTSPTPEAVMFSTIFFDYRSLYGWQALADELTEHIFNQLDHHELFLILLAKDAVQTAPPLTFFRNFVVERSGEHKDAFDIKSRAMLPLADAARLLVLQAKVGHTNNTIERFEKMAEREPANRELYEEAARAYEVFMRYRTLQGLKNQDSGRFFNPAELTKMERLHLRNSFQPINELQNLIITRFQLARIL
ncbi:MAG: cyclic nucleotide-binding domain-containing protein [Lewinellaceae bacterium]|nr:cyclic nucleotide-binding domain-containing protein [Lewinellaceae bacterium]